MQVSSPSNKLEKRIRLKVKKETKLYQVFLTRTKFQSGANISNGTFTLYHQVILPGRKNSPVESVHYPQF